MKYNKGDKVRIIKKRIQSMNDKGGMDKYLGTIMTIKSVGRDYYRMYEDNGYWVWSDSMIECLVIHDGCDECRYLWNSCDEEPCCKCNGTELPSSDEYKTKLDLWESSESDEPKDVINHPKHYNREDAMECIEEMIAIFGVDYVKAFCLCNSWKYRYRAADKNGEEDIKKSDFYIKKYIELCKGE